MKILQTLLLGGMLWGSIAPAFANDTLTNTADTLSKSVRLKRNLIVGGSSVVFFSGTYWFLKHAWWKDQSIPFHFDNGPDLKYASNLDKAGHFMGGVFVSEMYNDGFRWAGVPARKALWYSVGMAFVVHLSTEIKDGFAPRWGFSPYDLLAGTLGGLYTVGKHSDTFLKNTTIKATYWQRTDKYFQLALKTPKWFSIDDYLNQTFWFSYYFNDKPHRTLPSWLGVSVGWGIEPDYWNGFGGARHELYLAPDIHLERLLRPKKQPWKSLVKVLNFTRLPLPALQITPKVKVWGLFL
ncbi:MAG: hypothetical protein U0Y10_21765 [Spirosomataceae bacterium]